MSTSAKLVACVAVNLATTLVASFFTGNSYGSHKINQKQTAATG